MLAEINLKEIKLHLALSVEDRNKWISLCSDNHYLGFKGLFGKQLLYFATHDDEWIALLSWSSSALALRQRDTYIGWEKKHRDIRSHLVINNSRFLILPQYHQKNLASFLLAKTIRQIQNDWHTHHKYRPVLAETFVDPTKFTGASYKAAGWLLVGKSAGYKKVPTGFEPGTTEKLIFLKLLQSDALEILRNPYHTDDRGKEHFLYDVFSLPIESKGGLIDVIKTIDDPRSRQGRQHSLVSILSIATCAILSGAKSFVAISEWASNLTPKQLLKLRCRKKTPPSLTVIKETLYKIAADEFDKKIGDWLLNIASKDNKVKAIAVDGKTLRGSRSEKGTVQLLGALVHSEKIMIAQKKISDKTNEIPELRKLLENITLENVFVTADALHCQKETMEFIEKKRGFFVVVAKENQPTLLANCQDAFSLFENSVTGSCEEQIKAHNRIDTRRLKSIEIDEKIAEEFKFPHVNQILQIERHRLDLKSKKTTTETVYAITNAPSAKTTPSLLLEIIRGHWKIENSNHYVRDVTFEEDKSKIRTGSAPQVFATLRNLSIGIMRVGGEKNMAKGLRSGAWGKNSEVIRALGII